MIAVKGISGVRHIVHVWVWLPPGRIMLKTSVYPSFTHMADLASAAGMRA